MKQTLTEPEGQINGNTNSRFQCPLEHYTPDGFKRHLRIFHSQTAAEHSPG